MNFRKATLQDATKLDSLLTKLIEDEKAKYDPDMEKIIVKDFYQTKIGNDGTCIYCCETETGIVGYIYAIKESQVVGKIDALFVEESMRKQGIASKLMELAIEFLKEEGIKKIEITVCSKNDQAKKLYEKVGFLVSKETMELKVEKR